MALLKIFFCFSQKSISRCQRVRYHNLSRLWRQSYFRLTEILGKTFNLIDRTIKRFFDTHLFKHVMFEICKEAYDCTRTGMARYVDYVAWQRDTHNDKSERYLGSIKKLNIDAWLKTHIQQVELIIDTDTTDLWNLSVVRSKIAQRKK